MLTAGQVAELLQRARSGDQRAIGRLISLGEGDRVVSIDLPRGGDAWVVGLTGAPGVGKSTTTAALVAELRRRGRRVGVLAVDPSSPFSGGALLGDRVRMNDHATDPGVYIRSLAARGVLGGLSRAVPHAVRVLDALGFDVVLLETVGVGQSEVDIAAAADTTLVLLAPGMGDAIQAAKAGILEIADVLVVNKADRDGAAGTAADLRRTVEGTPPRDRWRPAVVATVATDGTGIAELVDTVDGHRQHLVHLGLLEERRAARLRAEIEAHLLIEARAHFADGIDKAVAVVESGAIDPYSAARVLLEGPPA
ncbi:MAG: methylmalonyl Co-A mutase-associated GTPase MeaB [Sporichthyaceae bacterium]